MSEDFEVLGGISINRLAKHLEGKKSRTQIRRDFAGKTQKAKGKYSEEQLVTEEMLAVVYGKELAEWVFDRVWFEEVRHGVFEEIYEQCIRPWVQQFPDDPNRTGWAVIPSELYNDKMRQLDERIEKVGIGRMRTRLLTQALTVASDIYAVNSGL